MAGGEGTRLRPLTSNQPKPMMPIGNRPMMQHIVDLLKKHGHDSGVTEDQEKQAEKAAAEKARMNEAVDRRHYPNNNKEINSRLRASASPVPRTQPSAGQLVAAKIITRQ